MTIEAMKLAQALICSARLCEVNSMSSRQEMLRLMIEATDTLRAAIEQAEKQEPVAWMFVNTDGECEQIEFSKNWPVPDDPSVTRLYAAPREWQGLTDEERKSIREWQRIQEELGPVWAPMMLYLYEAIEAKLREKNG